MLFLFPITFLKSQIVYNFEEHNIIDFKTYLRLCRRG